MISTMPSPFPTTAADLDPTPAGSSPPTQAPILLTSFAPWLSHQRSNSSNDLLNLVADHPQRPQHLRLLQKLPVHFDLAPSQVLATIAALKPAMVVCCGMAEGRSQLTLEAQGRSGQHVLRAPFDLPALVAGLAHTTISQDAGSYVCNHLYYRLLDSLAHQPHCRGLFIHVPPLHPATQQEMVREFITVLQRSQQQGWGGEG